MLFNLTLANPTFPTCRPTPGKHQLVYHSMNAGKDISVDILDPNCQSLHKEQSQGRPDGGVKPDDITIDVAGWPSSVHLHWDDTNNWNYMRAPQVTFNGNTFVDPAECGTDTRADETVCLTIF